MTIIENFDKSLKEVTEHQTQCSKTWMVGSDIIFVACKPNAEIELEDAKEDMKLSAELVVGINRFATIVDIANIKSVSKAARDFYAQVQNDNPRNICFALIVNSFYTRIIANFFFGLKNSRTEMRIFNEKNVAFEWVHQKLYVN